MDLKPKKLPQFPAEIWEKIFKFLDPSEIYFCSKVCRQWRSIVRHGFIHPLFIPKILGKILDFLPFPSVLACRQVCKRWNSILDKLILQGFTTSGFTLSRKIDMPGVMDARFQSANRNPFPTRHLVVWFQCQKQFSRCTRYYRDIHKLLKLYGKHLKYLTIGFPQIHFYSVLFISNALRYVPNLTGFAIASVKDIKPDLYCFLRENQRPVLEDPCNCDYNIFFDIDDEFVNIANRFKIQKQMDLPHLKALSVDSVPPQVYVEILESSPNCHFIDIKCDYDTKSVLLFPTIFESKFRHIHKQVSSLTLTLNWKDFCRMEKSLIGANLNLKRLSICLYLYNRSEFKRSKSCCLVFKTHSKCFQALHNLLKVYGSSLQTLDVQFVEKRFVCQDGWFVDHELQRKFPSAKYLSNVERIRITGFFGDLHFLDEMSSLQSYSGGKFSTLKCYDDEDELVRLGFGFFLAQNRPQVNLLKKSNHYFVERELTPVIWGKNIVYNKHRMEWDFEPI